MPDHIWNDDFNMYYLRELAEELRERRQEMPNRPGSINDDGRWVMPNGTPCECDSCVSAARRFTRQRQHMTLVRIQLVDAIANYQDYASPSTIVYACDARDGTSVEAMQEAIRRLQADYNVNLYGTPLSPDDEPYYDDSDYGYDDDPYDSGDASSDLVHYHDYRPRPKFYGDGPLFMGFELETAVSRGMLNEAARIVTDRVGDHAYLKEDGSISYGFEIVSHPMSYEYALNHFPWELMRDMQNNGIGPDDSTGLHVHVSRAAFTSPLHIYKWMKFIYRNQDAVQTVARRSSTGWAKFERDHRASILEFATRSPMDGYSAYADRYSAINVLNDATFEMRIFNSTNKRQELQAALGFVDASVRYAAEIDSAAILNSKAWEFPAFANWAYTAHSKGKAKASYSPLVTEMDRLELV